MRYFLHHNARPGGRRAAWRAAPATRTMQPIVRTCARSRRQQKAKRPKIEKLIQQSIKKKRMRQEAAPAPEVQQCRPQLNEGAAKPNPNVGTKRRMSEMCQKLAPLMRRVSDVPTELSEREVGGRAKAPPSRQRLGIALNAVTRSRCENESTQHADQTARRTNRSEKASLYENDKQEVNVPEKAKVAAPKRRGPILSKKLICQSPPKSAKASNRAEGCDRSRSEKARRNQAAKTVKGEA